ncbi:MAG: hypothetical protein WC003_16000 [Terrimicrobiaceae bacterium]
MPTLLEASDLVSSVQRIAGLSHDRENNVTCLAAYTSHLARFMLFRFPKEVFEYMEIREHMDHAYARRLAAQVAKYLKDRYGARKVLVFGSLVTGFFNPDFSPINVGFEGARDNLDADAISDCRFHFGHRDPDGLNRLHVVSLKDVTPEMRDWILWESEEV